MNSSAIYRYTVILVQESWPTKQKHQQNLRPFLTTIQFLSYHPKKTFRHFVHQFCVSLNPTIRQTLGKSTHSYEYAATCLYCLFCPSCWSKLQFSCQSSTSTESILHTSEGRSTPEREKVRQRNSPQYQSKGRKAAFEEGSRSSTSLDKLRRTTERIHKPTTAQRQNWMWALWTVPRMRGGFKHRRSRHYQICKTIFFEYSGSEKTHGRCLQRFGGGRKWWRLLQRCSSFPFEWLENASKVGSCSKVIGVGQGWMRLWTLC